MEDVVGAPIRFCRVELKDVLVIKQDRMGAGLKSTALYEPGEAITFYFGKMRRGKEILDDPMGRYILTIDANYLYANAEFSEKLTLTSLAEKKAMGACINASNKQSGINCTYARREATLDSAGNIWVPVYACKLIKPGDYFFADYDPNAGYGCSLG